MPTVDTNVKELIINELTKAQYNAAVQAGTINENELYMVTDESYPTTEELVAGYQPLINSSNKLSVANISGLANVATTGEYSDLVNKPTIPAAQVQSDWNASSGMGVILNKPTIPTTVAELSDASNYVSISNTVEVNSVTLANIATSGDYNDLTNKPTIPAAQVQSDWNATSGMGVILNKPTLANVATTGEYSDLVNKPTIPVIDQTYNGSSTNAQSGVAVKSAIDSAISSVYKPAGSSTFAGLPTPGSNNKGNVYNMSESFTTDSRFVEGSGKTYPAGTNVVIVESNVTYYAWLSQYGEGYVYTINELPQNQDRVYKYNNNILTDIGYIVEFSNNTIRYMYYTGKDYADRNSSQDTIDIGYAFDVLSGFIDLSSYATTASLANVATTGEWADIVNKPAFKNIATTAEWSDLVNVPSFKTVATTGDYDDLTNKPTIPDAQVQSDWNATTGMGVILNKPTFANVAISGEYSDLVNKPTWTYNAQTETLTLS